MRDYWGKIIILLNSLQKYPTLQLHYYLKDIQSHYYSHPLVFMGWGGLIGSRTPTPTPYPLLITKSTNAQVPYVNEVVQAALSIHGFRTHRDQLYIKLNTNMYVRNNQHLIPLFLLKLSKLSTYFSTTA